MLIPRYEYSGYLRSLLSAPDPAVRDQLDHITFTADALATWQLLDDSEDREWQHIPAKKERTPEGVLLQGNFEDMRRIENLGENDPSFWVSLTSRESGDGRFPVDVGRYPIIEITYRCRTAKARPAWVWHYPGGRHFDGLQPTREWRTIARRVPHYGYPSQVDSLTFRLFAVSRSIESFEIKEVRFRAMSHREQEAFDRHQQVLAAQGAPPHYALLDEFMPLGVFMKAGAAKRLAETMEVPFRDYWRLALEDIARHHHNCVALEEMDHLSDAEWREVLGLAESVGLRILAMHHWPLDRQPSQLQSLVDRHIRPYAESPAILGWTIQNEAPDHTFQAHLHARKLIEEADPYHPLAVFMRDPNSFPLFAPSLAAAGITHFRSHAAWSLGETVRTHYSLSKGQQMWVGGPAFVYATDTPEWYTCPEMRLMLNMSFANGGRGWFAFSYHNEPIWNGGESQRSLTGPFLTFSDLWSELGHRMERFTAFAPLFLNSVPGNPPQHDVELTWEVHSRYKRPEHVSPIERFWLQGPDYQLLYIINNDISEVTSLYINLPREIADGAEVYDITDFVRSRVWGPMDRRRHIEMFPGQGQIILVAEPAVGEYWRNLIVERIMDNDRRQISLDLGIARRYDLDIANVQHLMQEVGMGSALDDLHKMRDARDHLMNLLYASPKITAPRSKLIQASAALSACDAALCRLLSNGKVDQSHELGLRVLPLTRDLTRLRLKLRRGRGSEVEQEAGDLARRCIQLLSETRP